MNKRIIFIFGLISVLISGCYENKYPDFDRTSSGIYYKFFTIGDENIKPVAGDFVTVDLIYKTLNDSVFFTGRRNMELTEPDFEGSIDECFLMMSNGDCAGFIINANDFFTKTLGTELPSFFTPESDIKIIVYLLDVKKETDFAKEKEDFLSWIDDFGEYECKILKEYIENKEISILPVKEGLYYFKVNEGNGTTVKSGDTVVVHYEGRFLNGGYFDSTYKRNQAFEFVLGQEWQVIEGLEKAIRIMSEGEKAIFVIQSQLAFGSKGSSTGIVPPFTSIIFEVDLIDVKKCQTEE
ncbi:MAG TPA: hypothetical protein DDX39_08405 [Bacteroidales bacterium]|nr:MAG: hypothetical protein A2W98_09810 [Bacteroidetes bacterium GWF2_33_38]OFY72318.1 MAG: hypothetical protein A2265_00550 [Bacteroidetes bacterium RIFOXYA12_FULL_33_9]OFY90361.1 MAG: hypothetical protein A2236_06590 [Bacteroidetes bacterium RIFOXYA2_FULL_33_7]HBF88648.1 hypothetical protein [Bacteroidales bacterium]